MTMHSKQTMLNPLLSLIGMISGAVSEKDIDAWLSTFRHSCFSIQLPVVGAVSTYKSKRYFDSQHERTEQLASTLAATLALSRVIHAVQLMLREETVSQTTCESLQKTLNVWIQRYAKAPNESPSAARPLSEGSITVTQDLEKRELLVQLRVQPGFRMEWLEEPVEISLMHCLT